MAILSQLYRQVLSMHRCLSSHHPIIYSLVIMMALFLFIQIIAYGAFVFLATESTDLTNDTSSYPPNVLSHIFPDDQSELVVDIYNGSLGTLTKLIKSKDVVMAMMYAPWCAHSLKVAKVLLETAHDNKEVLFVGINCWEPRGDCRRIEGIAMFPRIFIYHTHIKQKLEYFGERNHNILSSYSARLLRPLKYETSVTHIKQLLGIEELLIVGYFEFTMKELPFGYKEYYLASLLALQTDPSSGQLRTPLFIIVTNKHLAKNMSLPLSPSISLLALQRGIISIYNGTYQPHEIYEWAVNSTNKRVVNQLLPSGDLSYLLTTPISLLFIPLSPPLNDTIKHIITQFRSYALFTHKHLMISSSCRDLHHLKTLSCFDLTKNDNHISLPTCSSDQLSRCPKYNPFYHNGYIKLSNSFPISRFCQDGEGGIYTGGWPPPCNPVYIKFYIIDSTYYWSLAESMGVVSGRGQPTLITVDLKNRIQFISSIRNNITQSEFRNIFDSVLIGTAKPLYRSGRDNDTTCWNTRCVTEITADTFESLVLNRINKQVVLLFHYTGWCSVCTYIWPIMYSLSMKYQNNTDLIITKMNGDINDLSMCHTPSVYPSIALYPIKSNIPLWYPNHMTYSVDHVIQFIKNHTLITIDKNEEEVEEDRWSDMGWYLWELSEKTRRSLEDKNLKLAEEVNVLRQKLKIIEKREEIMKREKNNPLESLMSQIEEAVSKIVGTESNLVNKETNLENKLDDVTTQTANEIKDHTPTCPNNQLNCNL